MADSCGNEDWQISVIKGRFGKSVLNWNKCSRYTVRWGSSAYVVFHLWYLFSYKWEKYDFYSVCFLGLDQATVKKELEKMMPLQRYQQAKTASVDQTGSNSLQYHHEEKKNLNKRGEFQHPELTWMLVMANWIPSFILAITANPFDLEPWFWVEIHCLNQTFQLNSQNRKFVPSNRKKPSFQKFCNMQITRKWKFKQKGNAGIEKFDALCHPSEDNHKKGFDQFMDFLGHFSGFLANGHPSGLTCYTPRGAPEDIPSS